jgi:hypothetical protein
VVSNIGTVWFADEKTSCSYWWRRGGSSYDSYVIRPFSAWIVDNALRQARRTYGTRKNFLVSRHSMLSIFFFFISPDKLLCIMKNMGLYTYAHIWLRIDCMWITVTIKNCEWNILTPIGSGANCWLDIYHWGAGLSVTGRIRDIWERVLQSSFWRWNSNSPRYLHIFFLIAFLE